MLILSCSPVLASGSEGCSSVRRCEVLSTLETESWRSMDFLLGRWWRRRWAFFFFFLNITNPATVLHKLKMFSNQTNKISSLASCLKCIFQSLVVILTCEFLHFSHSSTIWTFLSWERKALKWLKGSFSKPLPWVLQTCSCFVLDIADLACFSFFYHSSIWRFFQRLHFVVLLWHNNLKGIKFWL